MSVRSSRRFLRSLGASRIKFGLTRVRRALASFGHPENRYPVIHIAGTNGKGSTASMIANAFHLAGYKTGLYTSPHLVSLRERYRINGRPISEALFDRLVRQVRARCRQMLGSESKLTQFEFLTVLAFVWFEREKIDVGVVEVGLGGRLDATNVARNVVVSVITNIDLDHTQWLGKTRRLIAREKAGIIKNEVPVVTGAEGEARKEIVRIARKRGSPVTVVPRARRAARYGGMRLTGPHQAQNAAVAEAALLAASKSFAAMTPAVVHTGILSAKWPGRFERFIMGRGQMKRTVYLDGAHNPAAMAALARTLNEEKLRSVDLLFGALVDKDSGEMARVLSPFVRFGVAVPLPSERSANPEDIARLQPFSGKFTTAGSIQEGWNLIKSRKSRRPILVTGSLYLVGGVRKILEAAAPSGRRKEY